MTFLRNVDLTVNVDRLSECDRSGMLDFVRNLCVFKQDLDFVQIRWVHLPRLPGLAPNPGAVPRPDGTSATL